MRRLITLAAALLTGLGMSVAAATGAAASVCQGSGASCTAAGMYSAGPNATINSDLNGASIVWTSSKVAPYSSGVPLSWTVYVTYTNVSSSPVLLTCEGGGVGNAYEVMSGGSGDDGAVAASSGTCTVDPSLNVTLEPGDSYQNFATFDNVPWPGSTVALMWGSAGTSASVTPWTCAQPGTGKTSAVWAGYTACGVNADSITATWAVPIAITSGKPANSGSGFWVGLGGTTSDTANYNGTVTDLEQTGTASDVVNGSPKYFAWYELTPADPVTIPNPVGAGDAINATVSLTNGDQYHFTVTDHGKWTFTKTVTDSHGGHNSAEAIAEWASGLSSCNAPSCPLTDFSTVAFSGIQADGYSLGSYHPTVIQMYQNEVTVSSLRSGTSYTAYYQG